MRVTFSLEPGAPIVVDASREIARRLTPWAQPLRRAFLAAAVAALGGYWAAAFVDAPAAEAWRPWALALAALGLLASALVILLAGRARQRAAFHARAALGPARVTLAEDGATIRTDGTSLTFAWSHVAGVEPWRDGILIRLNAAEALVAPGEALDDRDAALETIRVWTANARNGATQ